MKRQKQSPLHNPVEYELSVVPRYSEPLKKNVLLLTLSTVKEFRSFRYELVIGAGVSGDVLRLEIQGLRAPQPALPASGAAVFRKEFEDLSAVKQIVVAKLDGAENVFHVEWTPAGVRVVKRPKTRFVEVRE